jgi:hypothetical protein
MQPVGIVLEEFFDDAARLRHIEIARKAIRLAGFKRQPGGVHAGHPAPERSTTQHVAGGGKPPWQPLR